MSDYRFIVRHVRYWRGAVHRWSTSYEFTGSGTTPDSTACSTLLDQDSRMCYSGSAEVVQGGAYAAVVYRVGGGLPLASYTAFNYASPGSWVKYVSSAYTSRSVATENVAETALLVEWPAGISSTGKPVKFRKWYHAVPTSASVPPAADVPSSVASSLQTQAISLQGCLASGYGLSLGNARRLAGTPAVSTYYSNHQMPRGRRRKALVTAGGRYTGPTIDVPEPLMAD